MKHSALSLLVLLAATLGFGRTPSPQDTAQAVKGVLRLRDGMHDPDNFQVSRVLITDKGVCIDYRSKNGSGAMSTGFAVYKVNKDTLWVDNSWVWEQACLFGKLAQRRDGMDITEAARAALKGQQAARVQSVTPAVPLATPAAQPLSQVAPVGVPVTTSPGAVAVPQPTPVVPAPAPTPAVAAAPAAVAHEAIQVQPLSPVVPIATAPVAQPVPLVAPVGVPAMTSPAAVAVPQPASAAPPAVAAAPVAAPVPVKAPVTASAPVPGAARPAAPPVASIQVLTVVPASPATQSTERPVPAAVSLAAIPVQPMTPAVLVANAPGTQPVPPVGIPVAPSQTAATVAQPIPVVPAPVAQPAVAAAPLAAPMPIKTLVTPQEAAPVATHKAEPPDVAPIHVIAVVPASGGTRSTVPPAPSAQRPVATVTVPPVAATPQPSSTPATSMEPPSIRGIVILDSQGALGKPTPSLPAPAQESVADVARRLKKAKQQAP